MELLPRLTSPFNTSAPAVTEPDDKGKRRFTDWRAHDRAPTIDDVQAHLDGKRRMHAPTTTRWCQLDIDHPLTDEQVISLCRRIDITPLVSTPVVSRSKSGGVHVDLMFIEDVDTAAVTKALVKRLKLPKEWKVELFDTSKGSLATVPYFNMQRGIWYSTDKYDPKKFHLSSHKPHPITCPKWRVEDLTDVPLPTTRIDGDPRIPVGETSRRRLILSVLGSARRLGWGEDEMAEYIYRKDATKFDGHRAYEGKPACQDDPAYQKGGKNLERMIRDYAKKPTGAEPDPKLDAVLERYAYLVASDTGCIVDLKRWERGENDPFMKTSTFKELYANRFTLDGKPVGHTFMRHPRRKTVGGFLLDPSTDDMFLNIPGEEFPRLNLFRGWGVKPIKGSVRPWRQLLALVSKGNRQFIRQVDAAAAQMFQEPGNVKDRPNLAFMLSGDPGTGKSSITETVKDIAGPHHALEVQSANELFPEKGFNENQLGKIFIMIEEAIFGRDHSLMNKLKSRISSSTIPIHPKFRGRFDVDNIQRMFATTNDNHALSLTSDDRRWTTIEARKDRWDMATPEGRAEAKTWFDNYHEWRRNGGSEAILYYYLHKEIDREVLKHPIETEMKKKQVQHSLTPVQRWAVEIAERGFLPEDGSGVGFVTPAALRYEIRTVTGKFDTEVFQPKLFLEEEISGLELKPGPVVRVENEFTGKSQAVRTLAFPGLLEFRLLVQRTTGFDQWDEQTHWRSPDGDPILDEEEWLRVMKEKTRAVEMFGAEATAKGEEPL